MCVIVTSVKGGVARRVSISLGSDRLRDNNASNTKHRINKAVPKELKRQEYQIMAATGTTGNLPPGWTAGQAVDGRTYYINHASKTTTWEVINFL